MKHNEALDLIEGDIIKSDDDTVRIVLNSELQLSGYSCACKCTSWYLEDLEYFEDYEKVGHTNDPTQYAKDHPENCIDLDCDCCPESKI